MFKERPLVALCAHFEIGIMIDTKFEVTTAGKMNWRCRKKAGKQASRQAQRPIFEIVTLLNPSNGSILKYQCPTAKRWTFLTLPSYAGTIQCLG
jgi:hypothetical protein